MAGRRYRRSVRVVNPAKLVFFSWSVVKSLSGTVITGPNYRNCRILTYAIARYVLTGKSGFGRLHCCCKPLAHGLTEEQRTFQTQVKRQHDHSTTSGTAVRNRSYPSRTFCIGSAGCR